jgi:hypothetical protein
VSFLWKNLVCDVGSAAFANPTNSSSQIIRISGAVPGETSLAEADCDVTDSQGNTSTVHVLFSYQRAL